MKKDAVSGLSRSLMELAWHFGPGGPDGECCDNLTMPEFLALDTVASTQDCAVSNVGLSLGFTKSGGTRIVNRLEKKGYIRKVRSSEDARVCCVVITDQGSEVLKRADERYVSRFRELVSRMPGELSGQAEEVLSAMARALKG